MSSNMKRRSTFAHNVSGGECCLNEAQAYSVLCSLDDPRLGPLVLSFICYGRSGVPASLNFAFEAPHQA